MLKIAFPRHFLSLLVGLMLLAFAGRNSLAQTPVTVVSGASFDRQAPVAPGSIASAFGEGLSKNVVINNQAQLPTQLDGTTVTIRDSQGAQRLAPLYFVAPNQVNLLIPEATATGRASISVRASDGKTSTGEFDVAAVAPAFLTANASGKGVPAAVLLRVRDGALIYESLSQGSYPNIIPKPIDLGPPSDLAFLVLYATGLKGVPNSDGNPNNGSAEGTRAFLGGVELTPTFVGPSEYIGAEQINLLIPRSLLGSGAINLSLMATESPGGTGRRSNQVELAIASGKGPGPRVDQFTAPRYLAGERMTITGTGFSPNPSENQVRIGDLDARVISATATQLTVEIPFGVKRGKVTVSTQQGEGLSNEEVAVRTSISGFVVDTSAIPQPLRDVLVQARMGNRPEPITARTTEKGTFVLPDMEPGNVFIHVEGSTVSSGLPYTSFDTKIRAEANQDNRFATPISLQLINGNTTRLSPDPTPVSSKPAGAGQGRQTLFKAQNAIRLETQGVVLEIPVGATVTAPNGAPGTLSLTVVEGSRVPARLPEAIFSQRIVQVTPFGFKISPGAKLTFPNPDGFPANARVDLYSFDKDANINVEEAFRKIGTATVSANGQQIETEANAITETSYFFVSARQLKTTAVGQVVDGDKAVQQAIVQVRGQSEFTDGNGGFTPRDAAVRPPVQGNQVERLQADVSSQRSDGRVLSTSVSAPTVPGGITNFGRIPINLVTTNAPPVLLITPEVKLSAGQTTNLKFTAYDPDAQTIRIQQVLMAQPGSGNPGANFVQLILDTDGTGNHTFRFTPRESDRGDYTLTVTVVDEAAQQLSVQKTVSINVVGTPTAVTLSPAVPTCDSAIPSGPTVELTWTPSALATIYDVFRGTNEMVGSVSETRFTDKTGLTAGQTYVYRVVARNAAGNSLPSNEVSVQIPPNVCASRPVTVSFGTPTGTPTNGGTITIPVQVGDLSGRNVIAYEFDLGFDPAVLQFLDADSSGTLSSSMTVVHNASGNVLKVAAFVGSPVGGTGRMLIKLRFMIRGAQGASTPLRWTRFLLNEGDPLPSLNDGSFTVR